MLVVGFDQQREPFLQLSAPAAVVIEPVFRLTNAKVIKFLFFFYLLNITIEKTDTIKSHG